MTQAWRHEAHQSYLICGVTVPNDEFAILRGTDQEPAQIKGLLEDHFKIGHISVAQFCFLTSLGFGHFM